MIRLIITSSMLAVSPMWSDSAVRPADACHQAGFQSGYRMAGPPPLIRCTVCYFDTYEGGVLTWDVGLEHAAREPAVRALLRDIQTERWFTPEECHLLWRFNARKSGELPQSTPRNP